MGRSLNLKNPQSYNEKLQWLKLYDRNPEYTKMVDKYMVKTFISQKLGEEYVIPTLGVWNNVIEIDYENLPNQFVLKTTHGGGGGGVVICNDKKKLNKEKANMVLQSSMRSDIYKKLREWPYKNVQKRIIAEQYIQDSAGELNDYKVFCFNGEAKYVMVCVGRDRGIPNFYWYNREGVFLPYDKETSKYPPDGDSIKKILGIDKIFELSEILAKGIPQVRVDWYIVDGKIYFGEMTFFNSSGFDKDFVSYDIDLLLGSHIDLNKV